MSAANYALALCWKMRRQGEPGGVILWDGAAHKEDYLSTEERHAQARVLCARCPLLAECEEYLSDMEKAGERVDGVCAGRYSDVHLKGMSDRYTQTNCRSCGCVMAPQHQKTNNDYTHRGEGLCARCFPLYSRELRRK